MDKLEALEGNLVKEAGKSSDGKNVFVIKGLDEVERFGQCLNKSKNGFPIVFSKSDLVSVGSIF